MFCLFCLYLNKEKEKETQNKIKKNKRKGKLNQVYHLQLWQCPTDTCFIDKYVLGFISSLTHYLLYFIVSSYSISQCLM